MKIPLLSLFWPLLLLGGCAEVPVEPPHRAGTPTPVLHFPRASDDDIRRQALAATPPGTPSVQVAAFVAREMRAHGETEQWRVDLATRLRDRSMRVTLNSYHVLVLIVPLGRERRYVHLTYSFDAAGRLLDVGVSQRTPGLRL